MSEAPVVIVSGGSRGLGAGLVSELLAAGWRVACFSRSDSASLEESRARHGDELFWRAIDAVQFDEIREFVTEVDRRWGRIDALVNNAATGLDGLLTLQNEQDIHQILTINLESVLHLTRACTRLLLLRGAGSIVNISSVHGLRGHKGVAVYSATKAALDGLTRSLARELGERGIRVNSVAPGFFESDMAQVFTPEQRARIVRRTPLNRLGAVSDIVDLVKFLLSPAAGFITGQTIAVDGGISC